MPDQDYEAGRRDGQIEAQREIIASLKELITGIERRHSARLDAHDRRFSSIERIQYGMIGAIFLVQFGPELKALLGGSG